MQPEFLRRHFATRRGRGGEAGGGVRLGGRGMKDFFWGRGGGGRMTLWGRTGSRESNLPGGVAIQQIKWQQYGSCLKLIRKSNKFMGIHFVSLPQQVDGQLPYWTARRLDKAPCCQFMQNMNQRQSTSEACIIWFSLSLATDCASIWRPAQLCTI